MLLSESRHFGTAFLTEVSVRRHNESSTGNRDRDTSYRYEMQITDTRVASRRIKLRSREKEFDEPGVYVELGLYAKLDRVSNVSREAPESAVIEYLFQLASSYSTTASVCVFAASYGPSQLPWIGINYLRASASFLQHPDLFRIPSDHQDCQGYSYFSLVLDLDSFLRILRLVLPNSNQVCTVIDLNKVIYS